MRLPSITFRFSILVTLFAGLLSANPRLPRPITRLYFIDPQHWTIEFDLDELRSSGKFPDPADITVGCGESHSSSVPSMQECVKPVEFNTDSGIGLVSSEHIPDLELRPGCTVYVGVKDDNYSNEGVDLPEDIRPNSTLELNIYKTTCSEYIPGGSPVYDDSGHMSIPEGHLYTWDCILSDYEVTSCFTSSTTNGRINGVLTDSHHRPCPSFSVVCFADITKPPLGTATTSQDGSFHLLNLNPTLIHTLRFSFRGYQVDRPVQPFCDESGQVLDLAIQLQLPLTAITQAKQVSVKNAADGRMMVSSGNNGSPVVFTVTDNALQGNGMCEIYTLNGEKIRSLPFVSKGVGTYSIGWEGTDGRGRPVPAGTYLYRISIGGFHTIQERK